MTPCSSFLVRFLALRPSLFFFRPFPEVLEESEDEEELLWVLRGSVELTFVDLVEVVLDFFPGSRFLPLGGCT